MKAPEAKLPHELTADVLNELIREVVGKHEGFCPATNSVDALEAATIFDLFPGEGHPVVVALRCAGGRFSVAVSRRGSGFNYTDEFPDRSSIEEAICVAIYYLHAEGSWLVEKGHCEAWWSVRNERPDDTMAALSPCSS